LLLLLKLSISISYNLSRATNVHTTNKYLTVTTNKMMLQVSAMWQLAKED